MDETEKKLRAELENMRLRASVNAEQSWISESWEEESKTNNSKAGFDADADAEVSNSAMLDKLEEKKKELVCCLLNCYLWEFNWVFIVKLFWKVYWN